MDPLRGLFAVIAVILPWINVVSAYNYVVLHPFYAGSHLLTIHSIAEQLINRGHHVTVIHFDEYNGIKLKDLGPNHKEVILNMNNSLGNLPFTTPGEKAQFVMPMEIMWSDGLALSTLMPLLKRYGSPWTVVSHYCHQILGGDQVKSVLEKGNFDVAIVDLIYNECALALTTSFDIPNVAYWAFSFAGGEAEYTTAALPASHVPTYMSYLTQDMNFFQRVMNFSKKLFSQALMLYHTWVCDGVIQQYLPDSPSSKQLLSDLNGALLNSDTILDYPRLLPDTFLNIGGIQIAKEKRPLPKNIEDFINGAEHGIVLFTMGFIFKPAFVPRERIDAILNAFARLPQRVIVKFDTNVEDAPENVLVLPFLPQQDILAHPKTKVFVTHCGMHGVMEAIYHGVPMVGMPVFTDQGDVGTRMVEKGIAKVIDKFSPSDIFHDAIVEVRDNPKYKENVMALSKLMRLRRNHPMDDALWLLEYLAKTKGAKHLRLSSRNLNIVQYFCIDVMAFIGATLWLVFKMFSRLIGKKRAKNTSFVVKSSKKKKTH